MEKPLIITYAARKQWKADCYGAAVVYSGKCSDRNVRDGLARGVWRSLAAINPTSCCLRLASLMYAQLLAKTELAVGKRVFFFRVKNTLDASEQSKTEGAKRGFQPTPVIPPQHDASNKFGMFRPISQLREYFK